MSTDGVGRLVGLDWIAVDWGTSALRVWAMGANGEVLAKLRSDKGMGVTASAEFEPVLRNLIAPWRASEASRKPLQVVVCGMAGSRQGWRDAGYRSTPCPPIASDGLLQFDTSDGRLSVAIVAGLRQSAPPDVMRGEEVQLAGLLFDSDASDVCACAPGTHSKWILAERGVVTRFQTAMTGELFSLIANQSVVRHSVAAEGADRAAYLGAVEEAMAAPERLTAEVFALRARGLLDGLGPVAARARLSGLLVGVELAGAGAFWRSRRVDVIGAPALAGAYVDALIHVGAEAAVRDAEALTLRGLVAARMALRDA